MSSSSSPLLFGVSRRLLIALSVAAGFMVFLIVDQMHWWRLKPDYAFGWLVPLFVGYCVYERWPRLRKLFLTVESGQVSARMLSITSVFMGLMYVGGLLLFLLGAFYRAGAGSSQPGSLALAIGFSGLFLGLVYFNVPAGAINNQNIPPTFWRALQEDRRLRCVLLFLFPALVWILSAPLVTAVENAVSLFLLHKIVSVVFAVFNALGYTLIQEGNVLVLPLGRVGVADACSGIRSLTGCLFAGSFLAAVFLDRFWKKAFLLGLALTFAFGMNLLRSLFLTAWAYAYGSDAIEGKLHDLTGFAVLGLTVVGLFSLLPLFSTENWRRWFRLEMA